jgi:PHD/YefM family antitoxin component YafN of YafNO toxin-antitoxin module
MSQKLTSMPITKARINLGAVVERVRTKNEHIRLEKGGIAVATLINTEHLEDMQDALDLMIAREENRSEPLVKWTDIKKKYV